MSDKENSFFDRADEIIDVANKQADEIEHHKVSASTQYAAARYNAFYAASFAKDFDDFKAHRDEAIEFFTEKYKKYFTENIDDYIENYEKYILEPRNS